MISKILRSTAITVCLIVVLFAGTLPVAAHGVHTGAPTVLATSARDCHSLFVHLNGNQPPSVTCGDERTGSGNIQPDTTRDNSCNQSGVLKIYVDANRQGPVICFTGNGFVNLTDPNYYWLDQFGFHHSWNDVATSWYSGDWTGKFYSDINGGGIVMRFTEFQSGNFTWNPMPNDALSSICMDVVTPDNCPGAHG